MKEKNIESTVVVNYAGGLVSAVLDQDIHTNLWSVHDWNEATSQRELRAGGFSTVQEAFNWLVENRLTW